MDTGREGTGREGEESWKISVGRGKKESTPPGGVR